MPREHLWKEKGAALSASLTIKKKKKSVKNSAFFRQDQYDMLFEKSNCSSFSPKSSSADNYIFKYKGNLNSYS